MQATAKDLSVLYLLGCNEGPSKRYRVFNHIESLRARGVRAEWAWDIDAALENEAYVGSFTLVAVFRSGDNDRVRRFFALVKRLKIPLVYDIDDLVFDPSVVDQIDVYRKMAEPDQIEYLDGIRSISRTLASCEWITTSTTFLAGYIERFARKRAWVIPFGVNDRQVEIAKGIEPWFGKPRFIGYLSGTKTHQRDFEEVAPALRRILRDYDDVFLKLVGYLDVERHLPGLSQKILRVDFMDWQDLLIETGSLYCAVAPFEMDSLFCKAKSELKFVESGLCKIPMVASAVPAFAEAIEHGVNGFLASTPAEWDSALTALLDDPERRDAIGREAYATCRRTYGPKAIGRRLVEVYTDILEQARLGNRAVPTAPAPVATVPARPRLQITWIIPQPFEGSGGHRNIFRAIRNLSEFGHSCSLYVLPDNLRFSNGGEVRDFITKEFFDIKADEVVLGCTDFDDCDVMVCTYWTTAYIIKDNIEKSLLQVYFLQDYEPMFFPMGTDYVRAFETYKFGFHPITSGPWPLRMLESEAGVTIGNFFRFPLERGVYYPRDEMRPKKKRVAYFARPDMPRRCYPLGVAALAIVAREMPEVEIVFYGFRGDRYDNVPFPFTNYGLTDTIDELGNLYRSASVGICFSTTNPSLVPFEMMACGCPVVDLAANGNAINYGSTDNAMLVAASPEAIAAGILAVLRDDATALRLTANGLEFAKGFPSEIEMVRTIEGYILDAYDVAKQATSRSAPALAAAAQ